MKALLITMLLAWPMAQAIQAQDGPNEDSPSLKVGDEAPDFEMMGTDGKKHRLSDYRGKKWVVVAWYPMAMTPG